MKLIRKIKRKEEQPSNSKEAAKERLHLVLMQDRANVSADFLELMKQEIIEVIKKYIDVDEESIDVRLTNKENSDGTKGAPALYANIPILNIKDEVRQQSKTNTNKKEENKQKIIETKIEENKEEKTQIENEQKQKNETNSENEEVVKIQSSEENGQE